MKRFTIWPIAIAIGITDALLLVGFEFVGVDFTNWLWNDLFHTDQYRWLIFPVVIGLGLILILTIKLVRSKRVTPVETDLLEEINNSPTTLPAIGSILLVGAVSLLAGASLGPEAALMSASAAIGAYSAAKLKANSAKQILILASVGALLVAFVGSLLLVFIPLLLLLQGARKQKQLLNSLVKPAFLILVAGIASLITLECINLLTGKSGGYGTLPPLPSATIHDFLIALALGFVAGGLAVLMNWIIKQINRFALLLDNQQFIGKEWVIGGVFSVILGILYVVGGQSVQFSGSIGSHLLVQQAAGYSIAALGIVIVSKLLATAWSKGTGYRGGLVFPSIYIGVALGLLAGEFFPGLGGAGAILGAISGMLTAVIGSWVMAAIFLIAFLPLNLELWGVAACAISGTALFNMLAKRIVARRWGTK